MYIVFKWIFAIGFLPYLFCIKKHLEKANRDEFKFHFSKIKYGIVVDYIGHMGLLFFDKSIYNVYILRLSAGCFFEVFLFFLIIWMVFFYTISFTLTSLSEKTYKTIQQLNQYYDDHLISEEEYQSILHSLYNGKDIQLPKSLKKYHNHSSALITETDNSNYITLSNASMNTYLQVKSELLNFYTPRGLSIVIYDKETSWIIDNEQKNAYVSLKYDFKKYQLVIQWYNTDIPDFDVNKLQLV